MEEISLKAQELFNIGAFGVTNSFALTLLVSFILILGSYIFRKKINIIPNKVQAGVEMLVEMLLGLMSSILGDMSKAKKYFPLIATIFLFIMSSNLLGIFPGVGSLVVEKGYTGIPFFRSPASDLNFTLAIAVISVIVANIFGMLEVGFFKHLSKFFNFKDPIKFFIGILEFISELAKIISLSFRLFGNVFAGEVLLTIIFFLAPYFIPLPFLFLEMFVGFVQAFIFSMLTLVSIALHTSVEEH